MEKKTPKITKKQLVPHIKKAWDGLLLFLADQRRKYGARYNKKNPYEMFTRRFCDPRKEPEKFYDEYMLCLNKASNQPASVRTVIEEIGRQAVNSCLWQREKQRIKRQQKKQEKPKGED